MTHPKMGDTFLEILWTQELMFLRALCLISHRNFFVCPHTTSRIFFRSHLKLKAFAILRKQ
eukprot:UN28455